MNALWAAGRADWFALFCVILTLSSVGLSWRSPRASVSRSPDRGAEREHGRCRLFEVTASLICSMTCKTPTDGNDHSSKTGDPFGYVRERTPCSAPGVTSMKTLSFSAFATPKYAGSNQQAGIRTLSVAAGDLFRKLGEEANQASAWAQGRHRNNTASSTLKMAVVAPAPVPGRARPRR